MSLQPCGDDLMSEIRDLNDALTAANLELAAYRRGSVPAASHQRVLDQRDDALRCCDALTRELTNLRDSAAVRRIQEATRIMSAIGRVLSKATPADNERQAFGELFAWIAEHGERSEAMKAMLGESERWLAEKGQR